MPRMVMLSAVLASVMLAAGCTRPAFLQRTNRLAKVSPGPRVGAQAPELDGEDFDGRRVKLSDHRGKVVVLVFWNTGCGPCRAMIPHEREMAARLRDKPFTLISVNNDEDHDEARAVIAEERMGWTHVRTKGSDDPINRRWRVDRWPTIFVIDKRGVLRAQNLRGAVLEHTVEALLAEP